MTIKELEENQNIIANKLISIEKEIKEDLGKIRERDSQLAKDFQKAQSIIKTFEGYQRTLIRSSFVNKVCITLIVLFLIFLAWGCFLINTQANQIKDLEKTIEANKNGIVQVLLQERKFWVDNNDKVNWGLIKDMPEEIKNPKSKKKGK